MGWNGDKSNVIRADYKLIYLNADEKGLGVILGPLKELDVILGKNFINRVKNVELISDGTITVRIHLENVAINVVSKYAPEEGLDRASKEKY